MYLTTIKRGGASDKSGLSLNRGGKPRSRGMGVGLSETTHTKEGSRDSKKRKSRASETLLGDPLLKGGARGKYVEGGEKKWISRSREVPFRELEKKEICKPIEKNRALRT